MDYGHKVMNFFQSMTKRVSHVVDIASVYLGGDDDYSNSSGGDYDDSDDILNSGDIGSVVSNDHDNSRNRVKREWDSSSDFSGDYSSSSDEYNDDPDSSEYTYPLVDAHEDADGTLCIDEDFMKPDYRSFVDHTLIALYKHSVTKSVRLSSHVYLVDRRVGYRCLSYMVEEDILPGTIFPTASNVASLPTYQGNARFHECYPDARRYVIRGLRGYPSPSKFIDLELGAGSVNSSVHIIYMRRDKPVYEEIMKMLRAMKFSVPSDIIMELPLQLVVYLCGHDDRFWTDNVRSFSHQQYTERASGVVSSGNHHLQEVIVGSPESNGEIDRSMSEIPLLSSSESTMLPTALQNVRLLEPAQTWVMIPPWMYVVYRQFVVGTRSSPGDTVGHSSQHDGEEKKWG